MYGLPNYAQYIKCELSRQFADVTPLGPVQEVGDLIITGISRPW